MEAPTNKHKEENKMGYSIDESVCRVDFFKPSGKWYTTEAVKFTSYKGQSQDIFRESLRNHFKNTPGRLEGMVAVCLEPYVEHSFPLMITGWR